MNRDELEGKAKAVKGEIKQAAGDLTHNPDLHDEGVADEVAGKTQDAVGRAKRTGGGNEMSAIRIAAIVIIVAGILGLVYGGFSYTKETHDAKLGPIELSVKDKQTVNVPVWAGVGAIVIGGAFLLVGKKG
jgi:uncharacterized protein YjbJ (UPF0337 family)